MRKIITPEMVQQVSEDYQKELEPIQNEMLEESLKTKMRGRVEIGTGKVIIEHIETQRMKDLEFLSSQIHEKYKRNYPEIFI
jgi:hypothetical protein